MKRERFLWELDFFTTPFDVFIGSSLNVDFYAVLQKKSKESAQQQKVVQFCIVYLLRKSSIFFLNTILDNSVVFDSEVRIPLQSQIIHIAISMSFVFWPKKTVHTIHWWRHCAVCNRLYMSRCLRITVPYVHVKANRRRRWTIDTHTHTHGWPKEEKKYIYFERNQ